VKENGSFVQFGMFSVEGFAKSDLSNYLNTILYMKCVFTGFLALASAQTEPFVETIWITDTFVKARCLISKIISCS